MKKSLIATGAASLALAAMPVVGVFADPASNELIDTINVTVEGGCTVESAAQGATPGDYSANARTFSASIAVGTYEELTGVEGTSSTTPAQAMTIKCNVPAADNRTFDITAVADNSGKLLHGSDEIGGGTATSGNASAWAYTIDSGVNWNGVQASFTPVSGIAANTSTNYSFNPYYRVYVQPDQAPGLYEGKVTYTVALTQPQP